MENVFGDLEVVKVVEFEIESNVGIGEIMLIFGVDVDVVKVEIEFVNVSKVFFCRGWVVKCIFIVF